MDDVLFVWVIILSAVSGLLAVAANKFEEIAEMKGHSGYWGWCFWLGPVGWCMVIALPDRDAQTVIVQNMPDASSAPAVQNKTTVQNDELPSL